MKYLIMFIYAGVAITLMDSCKKESSSINNSSSIIGKWELRQIVANIPTVNYVSGNGSFFEFSDSAYSTTDSTYSFFVQGSHHKRGHYKIITDTSVTISTGLVVSSGQFAKRIILDNDTTSNKVFYQIINNKLIILSGNFLFDGGIKITYEKQ